MYYGKTRLDIVFEPYRRLLLGGIFINWLGIHKLYRVMLVILSTYLVEYLPRLSAITGLVVVMSCLTVLFRPFKDKRANQAAIFSNTFSICIAIVNIVKSALLNTELNSLSRNVLEYFHILERVLLEWLPQIFVTIWLVYALLRAILSKTK